MLPEALTRARAILEDVTPLKTDCGLTCGHICCHPMEGEMTGMLLICSGRCNRADRPLSCRLMPLIPVVREDGVKVATDFRAKTVCPLARQGKDALDPDFVAAVREVGSILAADEQQLAFLKQLTRQQDELKALRNQFRRSHHV